MTLVFNPANRFIWSMAIFTLFISGLFYLIRGLKKEDTNEKLLLIGFANFLLFYGLHCLFIFFSDYYVIGLYSGHGYYGDLFIDTTSSFYLLKKLAYISTYAGYIIIFFAFERITKQSRYILTFLELVFILITIFFDVTDFHYLFDFIGAIILALILIWLSMKSAMEFKAISVYFFIGAVIMLTGTLLNSKTIRNLNIISPEFAPLIVMIGAVIFMLPNFINPQIFSHSYIFWAILIIANIFSFIIYLNLLYITQYHFVFSISVVLGLFVFPLVIIHAINQLIKILKAQRISTDYIQKNEKDQGYLRIFSKPQKITEEEVSISKEKKICLVCKNKIARDNYICPNCFAFYCHKCKSALINSENACWVCNTPFDVSKPSKPFEQDKDEEVVVMEGGNEEKKKHSIK